MAGNDTPRANPRPRTPSLRSASSNDARSPLGFAAVPIHIRATKGEYAEACLIPGDPLRAKYVAETFLENAQQRNWERGMLGYTGSFRGKPVSVQATGMGCPSAAIVIEELAQLGVKRLLRIGTCGGLQADLKLGEGRCPISRRDDVGAQMTERGKAVPVPYRREAPEPPPGHIGEEDPLDRVLVAERKHLFEVRPLDQASHGRERYASCQSTSAHAVASLGVLK